MSANIKLLVLTFFIISFAKSQSLEDFDLIIKKEGSVEKGFSNRLQNIIGKEENRIYVASTSRNQLYVETNYLTVFDSTLKKISEIKINTKYGKNKHVFQKFVFLNKSLFIASSFKNKKTKKDEAYLEKIDEKTLVQSGHLINISSQNFNKDYFSSGYNFTSSNNGNFLLVSYFGHSLTGIQTMTYLEVFDSQLSPLSTTNAKDIIGMNLTEEFRIIRLLDNGNVLLRTINEDSGKCDIYQIDLKQEKAIGITTYEGNILNTVIKNNNGYIIVGKPDESSEIEKWENIKVTCFDLNENQILFEHNIDPNSELFRSEVPKAFGDLVDKKLFRMGDPEQFYKINILENLNGIYIVSEIVHHLFYGGGGSTGVMKSKPLASGNQKTASRNIYSDVIVQQLSLKGDLLWQKKCSKYQYVYFENLDHYYMHGSFIPYCTANGLALFYNLNQVDEKRTLTPKVKKYNLSPISDITNHITYFDDLGNDSILKIAMGKEVQAFNTFYSMNLEGSSFIVLMNGEEKDFLYEIDLKND